MLSKKALLLKPSPTLAMAAKARELAASGKDVVSLTVGEPDWGTFAVASQAGIRAIQEGFTKYTAVPGIPELRAAIAAQNSEHLRVSYSAKEVCVGAGAKFVIFAALQMLLDPGDEVLIPSPYWVSYPTMVELADGVSRIAVCGADVGFKLTPEILQKSITAKTKVLILCSPSNPTGLMYTESEMKALAEAVKKYPQLFVISDDIYNRLIFNGEKVAPHLLHYAPELKSRLLAVNGASKAYSMTGWRIGWAMGPEKLINVMGDYASQSTSNVCSITQKAALAAIQGGEADVLQANQDLIKKKDWLLAKMSSIPGLKVIEPQGAFYFWTDVSYFFGKKGLKDSKDIAQRLLEDYLVATVPGIEFGCEGYLRLSFATSQAALEKAVERFQKFSQDHN
jgi:aspartate aminotransferase